MKKLVALAWIVLAPCVVLAQDPTADAAKAAAVVEHSMARDAYDVTHALWLDYLANANPVEQHVQDYVSEQMIAGVVRDESDGDYSMERGDHHYGLGNYAAPAAWYNAAAQYYVQAWVHYTDAEFYIWEHWMPGMP